MQASGKRGRRLMGEINVVPYIDVMLVLVVILMVSAPFVNPSLVELPTMGKSTRAPDAPLEIVVKADGRLLLRDRTAGSSRASSEMRMEEIAGLLQERLKQHPDTPVVISGDKSVRYEAVTKVMDELYKMHVRRVGLAVKPAS
ncbi:MAG TPA: ExbD/TolR family protein [Steroidobacteraceae bacterium]|nr:ExbD/TolR family protein [Steroidobacteraceae bacterium]